jgi:lysozyme family protein
MWDAMVTNPNRRAEFHELARFAVAHKEKYQNVEAETGVPWSMVAVIHRRESSADFTCYLGNGQSLRIRTTLVPRGRGPFPDFVAGAVDALKIDQLTNQRDWRLEKQLFFLTAFNGWGYGCNSPYIWGGTNQQKIGKYVQDRVYDPHVWDKQPGCAPMLAEIEKLDPSVVFTRET